MTTASLAERALRAVLARRSPPLTASEPWADTQPSVQVDSSLPSIPASELPSNFAGSAFAASAFDGGGGAFTPNKVMHLARWPHLRERGEDELVNVARVCALLAYRPSVGYLVHRRLDMPRDEALAVLATLHAEGCIRLGRTPARATPPAAETESDPEPASASSATPPAPTIWGRLLRRLKA